MESMLGKHVRKIVRVAANVAAINAADQKPRCKCYLKTAKSLFEFELFSSDICITCHLYSAQISASVNIQNFVDNYKTHKLSVKLLAKFVFFRGHFQTSFLEVIFLDSTGTLSNVIIPG